LGGGWAIWRDLFLPTFEKRYIVNPSPHYDWGNTLVIPAITPTLIPPKHKNLMLHRAAARFLLDFIGITCRISMWS